MAADIYLDFTNEIVRNLARQQAVGMAVASNKAMTNAEEPPGHQSETGNGWPCDRQSNASR